MTLSQFHGLKNFPAEFVTTGRYIADNLELKSGDVFIGVAKKQIGKNDYSIIDNLGHPHHYDNCNLLYPDKK